MGNLNPLSKDWSLLLSLLTKYFFCFILVIIKDGGDVLKFAGTHVFFTVFTGPNNFKFGTETRCMVL